MVENGAHRCLSTVFRSSTAVRTTGGIDELGTGHLRPRRGSWEPPRRPEPQTRVNETIRVARVRLIGAEGEQLGIKTTEEARTYAYEKGLDLVEVAAQADPPVAKVMDFGKYRYELEQKAKAARKNQTQIHVKEIKLRPKIGIHDYETKKGHVVRFLNQRAKVKVTIMFRGREREHPDRGRDLLMRLAEDVKELGVIETQPLLEGRNMTMVMAPTKNAGVKRDAETEEKLGSQEEIQGDRNGQDPAPESGPEPQSGAQDTEG
ncbi:MAG TPA: translation initiation factor IF-3 [Gaiellaceae bacterium]|nr:translation initiation factor IF-3 [Gaiellaceae bacterium]